MARMTLFFAVLLLLVVVTAMPAMNTAEMVIGGVHGRSSLVVEDEEAAVLPDKELDVPETSGKAFASGTKASMAMLTYGDARVHFGDLSTEKVKMHHAWEYMALALGLEPSSVCDGRIPFSGDLYHQARLGVMVLIDGVSREDVLARKEMFPNLFKVFSDSRTVSLDISSDVSDVSGSAVLPLVKLLRAAHPHSVVTSMTGIRPVTGETKTSIFDYLSTEFGPSVVRTHRATCVPKLCTTKLVRDFAEPKDAEAMKNELNVVIYDGPQGLALDVEIAMAEKLASDMHQRHYLALSDGEPDLLVLRFRTQGQPTDALTYLDERLPAIMKELASRISNPAVVAQVVLIKSGDADAASSGSQQRRTLVVSGTIVPFQGFDYLLMSWTAVGIGLMLYIVLVCVPWVDALDPILRSGIRNDADDKRN